MSTELDKGYDRSPTVKFNSVGDQVVGMIVDKREAPLYKYGTREIEKDDKGRDRTQDVVNLLVLEGTTATVKADDIERPARVGEVVTVFVAKQMRYEFYEAKKKLNGSLKVSDVVRVKLADKKDTGKGNLQSVYAVGLRRAKADESALADKAEAAHKRARGIDLDTDAAEVTSSDAADEPAWDEDF